MYLKDLIGHLAIRTQRAKTNYGSDRSYLTEPVRILAVTENHIVFDHMGTREEKMFGDQTHILNSDWNDDNWTDYNELIRMAEATRVKSEKIVQLHTLQ